MIGLICPSYVGTTAGKTVYKAGVGTNTTNGDALITTKTLSDNGGMGLLTDKGFASYRDGTSNTIMLVESNFDADYWNAGTTNGTFQHMATQQHLPMVKLFLKQKVTLVTIKPQTSLSGPTLWWCKWLLDTPMARVRSYLTTMSKPTLTALSTANGSDTIGDDR